MSLFLSSFLKILADPSIQTVFLCGCGGGFDFVHSLLLYPELKHLGKKVIVGSYSFGYPQRIAGKAEVVFEEQGVIAKRVTAESFPYPEYGPEVHSCSFLDLHFPKEAPHFMYAYYARDFTVPLLKSFYAQLVEEHSIDAIVLFDGGSDSLMAGDEEGLGDPIEDAVSVTAVANLSGLKAKILISVGLGSDRFNHVSDCASLRAVSELIRNNGFLGSLSLEKESAGFQFYRDCLLHINDQQSFRSVISGNIISAGEGYFGSQEIPPLLESRVWKGSFFIWPLMSILWAFDVEKVAKRSLISKWILGCATVDDCHSALEEERRRLKEGVRSLENFPRHEDMRG